MSLAKQTDSVVANTVAGGQVVPQAFERNNLWNLLSCCVALVLTRHWSFKYCRSDLLVVVPALFRAARQL
jgi:hypothetical protein